MGGAVRQVLGLMDIKVAPNADILPFCESAFVMARGIYRPRNHKGSPVMDTCRLARCTRKPPIASRLYPASPWCPLGKSGTLSGGTSHRTFNHPCTRLSPHKCTGSPSKARTAPFFSYYSQHFARCFPYRRCSTEIGEQN